MWSRSTWLIAFNVSRKEIEPQLILPYYLILTPTNEYLVNKNKVIGFNKEFIFVLRLKM